MKTIVILPTYNECETIERMIDGIFVLKDDIGVIVVDDSSPDGTGSIADRLCDRYPLLEVMHRKGKRGRGTAGVAGFKRALEMDGDYIIEMDADLSHDPASIPDFIKAMNNADVVIGSRYIEGGDSSERNPARKAISILANFYIKTMMGIPHVKDCTSGFRCFKSKVLREIDLDTIHSEGPPIITEVLYRCRGYSIKEIPIIFKERFGGKSKFNFKAMKDSIILVLRLRINEILGKNKRHNR